MSEENAVGENDAQIAPGLAMALSPVEEDAPRRRGPDPLAALRNWTPRTRLGRMVMNGEILTYEEALATGFPIREVEIVDALLPQMDDDVLRVNIIQRMTEHRPVVIVIQNAQWATEALQFAARLLRRRDRAERAEGAGSRGGGGRRGRPGCASRAGRARPAGRR